jgi:hypothetical protein
MLARLAFENRLGREAALTSRSFPPNRARHSPAPTRPETGHLPSSLRDSLQVAHLRFPRRGAGLTNAAPPAREAVKRRALEIGEAGACAGQRRQATFHARTHKYKDLVFRVPTRSASNQIVLLGKNWGVVNLSVPCLTSNARARAV